MDPDLVRLILVVLGVALVAAIYLWDRYKRAAPRPARRRRRQPHAAAQEPSLDPAEQDRVDEPAPTWREAFGLDVAQPPAEPVDAVEPFEPTGPARRVRAQLDPEPLDLGQWSDLAAPAEPQINMDLSFDAHGDADYLSADPALRDEVEHLIVVVNVAARQGAFQGPAIVQACAAAGLVAGEMSIYHRHDAGTGPVLFSLASMVEPGTFPLQQMAGFSTPGLTLFTQLPGPRDGLVIYQEMLDVAEQLARLLQGELRDERQNKLTRQMQEHTRGLILEHRRRVRLARSRH